MLKTHEQNFLRMTPKPGETTWPLSNLYAFDLVYDSSLMYRYILQLAVWIPLHTLRMDVCPSGNKTVLHFGEGIHSNEHSNELAFV